MNKQPTVISLSGEYDLSRSDELDELLDKHGDDEALQLDLSQVECIDSGSLRSLVRFQRARREAGKSPLTIRRANTRVREFFEIANMGEILEA